MKEINHGWDLASSQTGESLTLNGDGLIQLWYTATWVKMGERRLDMTMAGMAFSKDGQWLYGGFGQISVASILSPGSSLMGKEIYLMKDRSWLLEGGKELRSLPVAGFMNCIVPIPRLSHITLSL